VAHAISATARSPFANLQGLQRAGALFFARPGWRNSRISAAQAMSPADNFLQKRQNSGSAEEPRVSGFEATRAQS
jgi:hypothetical protein